MKTKMIAGGALTGLVLTGGLAGFVSAQTAAEATGLTEEEVIELALEEVAGEVLEVELEDEDGQLYYEIEVLAGDGTEMMVEVAAETGEVLDVWSEAEGCDHDRHDDDDDHDDEDRDEA